MRDPASGLEHAKLGKPLSGDEVVVDRAGASEVSREPRAPADAQMQRCIRFNRRRQLRGPERAVAGIPVARRDVAEGRQQVLDRGAIGPDDLERGDLGETKIALGPVAERLVSDERALLQPGGVGVAERVPVGVQPD